ncbi:cortical protein KAR9-domain-containing protein [Aspergillus cavernicola]|uniref:Cortical protein KAR9-domain-containing protein n=1 Tax=Aspergillus cavernicola TaxID=176166 RepID=A0ABR4HKR5_9EURO
MEDPAESDPTAPPVRLRTSSPSPSVSPTPAISSCPSPDRTFSTVSSLSTSSTASGDARSSVSVSTRRRGYIRPQGAEFAASARNRESVMSLGSIAHLQYYFARTGLLDGKGGNTREYKKKKSMDELPRLLLTPNARFTDDLTLSPTEDDITDPGEDDGFDESDTVMLPPTVSTYSIKTHYIPPPPDLLQLRRDLLNAIWKAQKEIDLIFQDQPSPDTLPPRIDLPPDATPDPEEDSQHQADMAAARKSWDEIQGMRVLDVVTLAIRAAKIYYTTHEHPERLASIRSEREIRQELFNVLEVLKRWAARTFAGGFREDERIAVVGWMADVRNMLSQEAQLEDAEVKERAGWVWIEGDWTGREREREETFLASLIGLDSPLPAWTEPENGSLPSAMLERLRDGRVLVQVHNHAVKKSKRPFGEVRSFHEDVAKPYRRADNLRYWMKAAELRWETKLEMDVMGVVYGSSDDAWHQFDQAILAWCKTVREELSQDLRVLRRRATAASVDVSMRALFTASTPATPDFPPDTDTSSTSPPTLSVSSPYDPTPPRRIKSKSSLRSIRSIGSSSLHEDDYDEDPSDKTLIRPSILRRLSPGLAARVKLLDGSAKTANSSRSPGAVGRIPEEHIKELDSLHKKLSAKVEKKGRAWNGITLLNKSPKQQKQQPTLDVPEPEWVEDLELGSDHAVPLPDRREKQEEEVEETPTTMSVVESAPAPLGPEMGDSNAEDQAEAQTDFEKYIQTTSQIEANGAPPPPPKDSPPPPSSASSNNIPSFFNPLGLHRTDSIYSFSRSSFSNQISQLTSIILPQPSSLATGIASISNAPSAVKALTGAAEQIQIWIKKASDVLSGLDAEDDVEWAAAGGREGLDGVDKAITKFEGLVNVYVRAIEEVQVRDDIANVSTDSLETIVTQMDNIIRSWADIKSRLRSVKQQVELAMEWEELWNNVLGEVGIEINKLDRLVFEMEERRHSVGPDHDFSAGMDLNELETIVEETPSSGVMRSDKRSSIGSIYATAPALDTPVIQTPQDDTNISNLHELFARLQPLRASLDFLPMRLSMFQSRAERIFPSACEELVDRRDRLEKGYSALQTDAESLQKELVEDRWIMVFRNAGSQAQRMFESVERSILKLQEGLETGMHLHNPSGMSNRIESYEAKKQHYVPAIERVVVIIQKGLKDRLTINGEILRLLHGMTSKVDALKASIKVMDSSLEDVQHLRTQHMRDSISSIQTMDSPATGSVIGTPGSSPASSIVMTPANKSTAPLGSSARRGSSVGSAARTSMGRRFSGLPQPSSTKKSSIPKTTLTAPSAKPYGLSTPTPAIRKSSQPTLSPAMLNRPRWNGSTNTTDLDVGHTHKTLSPSLHKSLAPSRRARPSSTIPSPTHRDLSASPAPSTARSISRVASRLTSRSPRRTASPAPGRSLLDPPPYSKLNRPTGTENMSNAPRSRQSFAGLSFSRSVSQDQDRGLSSPTKATRPGTALGHSGSRRISLLPLPKNPGRKDNTPATRSKLADRPAWRG